jgi:peptidoglycan/LPS O-acetylase OafA/YrhL
VWSSRVVWSFRTYLAAVGCILERMDSGDRWRLGHRPALDGLRGVAVLLVVAYHCAPGHQFPNGGVVGVTLFFALSGFLITALLLEEAGRAGSVSLAAFYRRRALRLLPALIVMLAIVGSLSVVAGQSSPGDLAAILFYSADWWRASGHGLGVMLSHTWTLSVEEQFYFVWPLVFLAVRRSRRLLVGVAGAAVVLVVGRLVFAATGGSADLVYFTAGDALVAGCAVAILMHRRTFRHPLAPVTVPLVLAALVGECLFRTSLAPTLAVAAVLATAAVYVVARVRVDATILAWAPVRLVGRRSYGLYLWHLPVLHMVSGAMFAAGVGFWLTVAVALVATAVVTELSWRFVESPFLRLKNSRRQDTRPQVPEPSHTLAPEPIAAAWAAMRVGERAAP